MRVAGGRELAHLPKIAPGSLCAGQCEWVKGGGQGVQMRYCCSHRRAPHGSESRGVPVPWCATPAAQMAGYSGESLPGMILRWRSQPWVPRRGMGVGVPHVMACSLGPVMEVNLTDAPHVGHHRSVCPPALSARRKHRASKTLSSAGMGIVTLSGKFAGRPGKLCIRTGSASLAAEPLPPRGGPHASAPRARVRMPSHVARRPPAGHNWAWGRTIARRDARTNGLGLPHIFTESCLVCLHDPSGCRCPWGPHVRRAGLGCRTETVFAAFPDRGPYPWAGTRVVNRPPKTTKLWT